LQKEVEYVLLGLFFEIKKPWAEGFTNGLNVKYWKAFAKMKGLIKT